MVEAAAAQVCQVRNSYRIANSYSGASSELNVMTPWQTQAPLSTPGFNSNPGATCTSQGSCNPTSDYGWLHVDGAGSATNCASSGVFLWLDQGPQAQFVDTIHVSSASLPLGAPVQIQFVLSLAGYATLVDTNPSLSFGAQVYCSSLTLNVNNGPGVVGGVLNTSVGANLQVGGSLTVAIYPYGLLGLGLPPHTSSYAFDLTARTGISSLTAGVTLSACSGRSYDPLLAQVVDVGGGSGPGSPVQMATTPVLGQTQSYTLSAAPASQAVVLAFATGPAVALPLGINVITEDPATLQLLLLGVTDAAGGFSYGLSIPGSAVFAGQKFTSQQLVFTAGGPLLGLGVLSNGLQSTMGL